LGLYLRLNTASNPSWTSAGCPKTKGDGTVAIHTHVHMAVRYAARGAAKMISVLNRRLTSSVPFSQSTLRRSKPIGSGALALGGRNGPIILMASGWLKIGQA
jgi:hypothetical protein